MNFFCILSVFVIVSVDVQHSSGFMISFSVYIRRYQRTLNYVKISVDIKRFLLFEVICLLKFYTYFITVPFCSFFYLRPSLGLIWRYFDSILFFIKVDIEFWILKMLLFDFHFWVLSRSLKNGRFRWPTEVALFTSLWYLIFLMVVYVFCGILTI